MNIKIDDNVTQQDVIYSYAINLLSNLKLIQGPQAVYSTLRRHKELYNFIIEYASDHMKTIEGLIADLDN